MRISDWSSDVCASDRQHQGQGGEKVGHLPLPAAGTPLLIGGGTPGVALAGGRTAALGLVEEAEELTVRRQHHVGALGVQRRGVGQIGRASCQEREWKYE